VLSPCLDAYEITASVMAAVHEPAVGIECRCAELGYNSESRTCA